METYLFLYVNQIASRNLLSHRELEAMLCDNLKGWDGVGRFKREGAYVHLWLWLTMMYGRK